MIEFYQDCSYNGGGQSIRHPYFFWLVGLPIVFIGRVLELYAKGPRF